MNVKLLLDNEVVAEFDVTKQPVTVGRDESSDLQIDEESISGRHIRLFVTDDQLYIEDLGSANGTALDNSLITETTMLPDGSIIRLGEVELKVRVVPQVSSTTVATTATAIDPLSSSSVDPVVQTAPDPSKESLGNSLMSVLKEGAKEAQRGAKMASLRAQAEKLKHMDLPKVYRELGQAAFVLEASKDRQPLLFRQISEVDAKIAEKRKGNRADEEASFKDKAMAVALTAKMKAESGVLSHKRNALVEELGKALYDDPQHDSALHAQFAAVANVLMTIKEIESDYKCGGADHSAADQFAQAKRTMSAGGRSSSVLERGFRVIERVRDDPACLLPATRFFIFIVGFASLVFLAAWLVGDRDGYTLDAWAICSVLAGGGIGFGAKLYEPRIRWSSIGILCLLLLLGSGLIGLIAAGIDSPIGYTIGCFFIFALSINAVIPMTLGFRYTHATLLRSYSRRLIITAACSGVVVFACHSVIGDSPLMLIGFVSLAIALAWISSRGYSFLREDADVANRGSRAYPALGSIMATMLPALLIGLGALPELLKKEATSSDNRVQTSSDQGSFYNEGRRLAKEIYSLVPGSGQLRKENAEFMFRSSPHNFPSDYDRGFYDYINSQ